MQYTLNLSHKPTIIVLGDIFLDHTYYGNASRLANEAPIPVFKHTHEKWVLGGAGNVLANLASMGCTQLYAFGCIGNDEASTKINELLKSYSIQNELLYDPGFQTTIKRRYYCGKTLMFRHDTETFSALSAEHEARALARLYAICKERRVDCIVLSDYNKGFLTHSLCQKVITFARSCGIFTCVDPKEDASKYIGCSLIKPNRVETAKLFGIDVCGIDTAAAHNKIHERVRCDVSVITLSEHGASLHSSCEPNRRQIHCANEPMEVIDVTGAGDIVCATLAYLYPMHENKEQVLKLANVFAMISVGHLGSYVLQPRDFIRTRSILNTDKCIQPDVLRSLIAADKKTKYVFTNGCFDIIHVGHLELLKRCRAMGDIVIIGLNSDASIRRLKGAERPIMNLERRIAFLSALTYVDYICVFEEDTPSELLAELQPTILVKGGDYTLEQIVGREYVEEVRIIPIVEGYSSTAVIRTIRDTS